MRYKYTVLEKEKDYRRSIENPNYILKNYFDENGNFLYAKNEIEKVDEETNSHKKRSSNIKWVAD